MALGADEPQRAALVGGDVVGLVALDLVLRSVLGGAVGVALTNNGIGAGVVPGYKAFSDDLSPRA